MQQEKKRVLDDESQRVWVSLGLKEESRKVKKSFVKSSFFSTKDFEGF
jgi:hypothetical protein